MNDESSRDELADDELDARRRVLRDSLLAPLGYLPMRVPPLPDLGADPYQFRDDSLATDIEEIQAAFSRATEHVRQISPDVDLYELGLREVGESKDSAAAHLSHAQRLIHDGTVALDHIRIVLRALADELPERTGLGAEWVEYIRAEAPRREQAARLLSGYDSLADNADPPRRVDGTPLTSIEAGSLAQAYSSDAFELRQTLFLHASARDLTQTQIWLDEITRTVNDNGTFVLSAVIKRMRQVRVWALQLRNAFLAMISMALVMVGIGLEDVVTRWAGESLLIVSCAGFFMWGVADLISWSGERWIHRHHLAVLEEALTRTCNALITLRRQEHHYNVQRASCGWDRVELLRRPLVPQL